MEVRNSANSININTFSNTFSRPANKDRPLDTANGVQNPLSSTTTAEVAGKAVPSADKSENKQDNKNPSTKSGLSRNNMDALESTSKVVFEYNKKTGDSVIKFMDAKGNVVSQVPPEQYLKMKELLGSSDKFNIQDVSADTKDMKGAGLLLSKKV